MNTIRPTHLAADVRSTRMYKLLLLLSVATSASTTTMAQTTVPITASTGQTVTIAAGTTVHVPTGSAISATAGGQISGTGITAVTDASAPAVYATDTGSEIALTGAGTTITSGRAGAWMENGGLVRLGDGTVFNISGDNNGSAGIYVSNTTVPSGAMGSGIVIDINGAARTNSNAWIGVSVIGAAGNVSFDNLTVKGSSASVGGYAGNNGTLTLTNSNITINGTTPGINLVYWPSGINIANAKEDGLAAYSGGTLNVVNTNITVNSVGGGAVRAQGNATVNVTGGVFNVNGAPLPGAVWHGVYAGVNSRMTLTGTTINVAGDSYAGIRTTQNSTIIGDSIALTTAGSNAYGLRVSKTSTGTLSNSTVVAQGSGSRGIHIQINSRMTMNDGSVTMRGADSTGVAVDDDTSSFTGNAARVITTAGNSTGLSNAGTATLTGSTIDAQGSNSVGIITTGTAPVLIMAGGHINSTSTAVSVTGAGDNLSFSNGAAIASSGGTAFGVTGTDATIALAGGVTATGGNGILLDVANSGNAALTATGDVRLDGDMQAAITDSATATLSNNVVWSGAARNIGATSIASGSLWNMNGNSDVASLLIDNAAVMVTAPPTDADFKTLTVRGDYTGTNALLGLNTRLNAGGPLADQFTDRLIINGNAQGTTRVLVNGLGNGAVTTPNTTNRNSDGISIIQVAGTSTADAFTLATPGGYVAGGAYQYRLFAYGPGAANGPAAAEQNLTTASNGAQWDYRLQNPSSVPPGTKDRPALIPQAPTYINLPVAMMNAGFQDIDMLHRRLGELHDDNPNALNRVPADRRDGEAFLRVYGGRFDYSSDRSYSQYGYDFDQDYGAVQLGANVFSHRNENAITRVGFALTFGDMSMRTDSPNMFEGTSKAHVNTYSLQGYVTRQWDTGFYIDGVMSFGLFDGSVSNYARSGVGSVDGSSFAVGLEIGRPWHFAENWTLEPQAQLAYQRLSFDNQADQDGIDVHLGTHQQLVGRLGARLTRAFRTDENQLLTPYAKVNLIHGFFDGSDVMIGDSTFTSGSFGTSLQAGGGMTATLNDRWSVYGDAAWQTALNDHGFGGWTANAGLRYVW